MAIRLASKTQLLYLIFHCVLRSPDTATLELGSVKLNECSRCKLLTDSITYWLEKTSRGKYEGGDAAWEEAKLKTYAQSEIRFVEVQEGVCSEVKRQQDHCYALAEEAEQALEKWWFQEDPDTIDLYTWLCIETLQYCCPVNHYGENCIPCHLDKDNKVCSGRGKCDGDGTRNGNGTCICNRGYIGKICNECAINFYSSEAGCEPCHMACNGCSGDGPNACVTCKPGWQLVSDVCVDVNECSMQSTCKPDQFCVNKEGTHTCRECDLSCRTCMGAGPSNCTSCVSPNVLWRGMCIDEIKKIEIYLSTLKRLALYFTLIILTIVLHHYFYKSLASLVLIIIAVLMYFSEKQLEFNLVEVIHFITM